ncbi:hypothetical protein BC941DRAFT_134910 [Chlamydoabsidia padenii]|nr:hypothetical protein BC941DRAFT_134910 [Chlamydoabsidia padenii]
MNRSNTNTLAPIPINSNSLNTDIDTHGLLTSPIKIPSTTIQTSSPGKRPRPNFNSLHNERYSHSLRDFPLNHFNRQLTVEKATFDPIHAPSQQQQTSSLNVPGNTSTSTTHSAANQDMNDLRTPTMGSPTPMHLLHLQDDIPLPSSSSSSSSKIPEKSLAATMKKQDTQYSHSPPRSIITKLKSPSLPKPERRRSDKKKKRKLPPVNGTATPSEVFHRNLVDAVSNVEDSDENEQYVYPYSHHDNTASSITSSKKQYPTIKRHLLSANGFRRSIPRPLINSAPGSFLSLQKQQQQHQQAPTTSNTGGFLHDLVNRAMSSLFKWVKNRQQQIPQDEEVRHDYYRPKLRNYVMDHPRSSHMSFPHPWAYEYSSSDDDEEDEDEDDDDEDDEHEGDIDDVDSKYEYSNYHQQLNDNYRFGERTALLRHHLIHKKRRYHHHHSTGLSCRILRNTCISLFVFILVMMIFTVYRAEPLTDLTASMGHSLASDKELIFNLRVQANNWNWWTVRIQEADLSIFAFSDLLPLNMTYGVDPAEYLGACQEFDQPLSFTSSVLLPQHERATTSTQIKIKSPGADSSGNQRWSQLIRSPFGLVTRGVIKYRPFPLFKLSAHQSIPLCVVTHVDPTLATLNDDSDHGYCSHYLVSPS